GIVDTTAIAHYCHYWRAFQPIPQWTLALIALLVVLSMNLISVVPSVPAFFSAPAAALHRRGPVCSWSMGSAASSCS
ncbi:hypothetical protein RJR80_19360, partial [Mycobacterium tuberculosis]|nr:hypothetical protein [Mycobacterium tuberculosis]